MPVTGEQTVSNVSDKPVLLRRRLLVTGRVQGVGFRPFIYRLAKDYGLVGTVRNSTAGVVIDVQGTPRRIRSFQQRLAADHPAQAVIEDIAVTSEPVVHRGDFAIIPSLENEADSVRLTPDLAMCEDCRREILDPNDRRYRYPFTNCTNCGPRYSIIESLPYDRHRTSMRRFTMCPECQKEYTNPADRRFHAQPNACPVCGPHVRLCSHRGHPVAEKHDAILHAADALRRGRIVALKGLGGYQLLVDARHDGAVRRLRYRKERPEKPLAVMYPSLSMIASHCRVSPTARRWLTSPAAPIVLIPLLREPDDMSTAPAASVTSNVGLLGVMLPYTPLHFLLMHELGFPFVATSGNRGGDPICIGDDEAFRNLGDIADFFLMHDRPIVRAVDDSVVRPLEQGTVVIRLSRGLAPAVIRIPQASPTILAAGGHLKNAFAIAHESRITVSQHIGDLDSPQSRRIHVRHIGDLTRLIGRTPSGIACDSHPDYFSTSHALTLDAEVQYVQHHVAHVLTGIAEHGLRGRLVGFAWDGTGLGEDGGIWGGETFIFDHDMYERAAILRSFPLPGGDAAVRNPRRSAIGLLYSLFGSAFGRKLPSHFKSGIDKIQIDVLERMLNRSINCPTSTSVGRLFDAVAALLGVSAEAGTYEGQAAMMLEAKAWESQDDRPLPYAIVESKSLCLDWGPMIEHILNGLIDDRTVADLARRFHATLAAMMAEVAVRLQATQVVLGGGCFQNTTLLEMCRGSLEKHGLQVFWPQTVPINDGGLAVGQAYAAARGIRKKGSDNVSGSPRQDC